MSKISIKNMNLYYGDFHALKDVNLEIEPNKITAFYRTFRFVENQHY